MKSMNWFKILGAIALVIVLILSIGLIVNLGSGERDPANEKEVPVNTIDDKEDSKVEDNNVENSDIKDIDANDNEIDDIEEDIKTIQSESVEVYVQDICITPQTLQFMASNNGLELIQMEENSATIGIDNDEQRVILYEELSKMGEVKETGGSIGGDQVKVVIKSVDD